MNDPLSAPVDSALSPELPITEETREPVACRFVDFPLAEDVQDVLNGDAEDCSLSIAVNTAATDVVGAFFVDRLGFAP